MEDAWRQSTLVRSVDDDELDGHILSDEGRAIYAFKMEGSG